MIVTDSGSHRPGYLFQRRTVSARTACLALSAVLLLPACRWDKDSPDAAVARVGPDVITTEEFRLSYQLGFPGSRQEGQSQREAYLDRMIDERLLSIEGYRTGVDRSVPVLRKVRSMREELLVEAVFEHEVNERVTVSDEQILDALGREGARFKMRYLPAATEREALDIRDVAVTEGFENAASRVSGLHSEPGVSLDLESPYLASSEIDASLLDAVADLEAGEVSAPIPFRGAYIVVELVDVRRTAVGTNPEERARVEQVQSQREAGKMARAFVSRTMKPLDLRLKAAVYARFRKHLWDWYRVAAPDGNLLAVLRDSEGQAADSLRALLGLVIMTTRNEEWSVQRFLEEFPADRYPLSTEDTRSFESDLYDAFGLTLRDRAFVALAEEHGWDDSPGFRKQMKRWTDKWVYRAMVEAIGDTVRVTAAEAREYFSRHRDYYGKDAGYDDVEERVLSDARAAKLRLVLRQYVNRLRRRYSVEVDRSVLAGIDVEDPESSTAPAVTIVKGHTGRLAYPVADPTW